MKLDRSVKRIWHELNNRIDFVTNPEKYYPVRKALSSFEAMVPGSIEEKNKVQNLIIKTAEEYGISFKKDEV